MINIIIEKYINKLSKNDIIKFGLSNDIKLSTNEIDYIYNEIKKNWKHLINDPILVNSKISDFFVSPNREKILLIYNDYYNKYKNYL